MSVKALEQENPQLKTALLLKEKRIAQLEELIRGFNQKQFGASSEQSPSLLCVFDAEFPQSTTNHENLR